MLISISFDLSRKEVDSEINKFYSIRNQHVFDKYFILQYGPCKVIPLDFEINKFYSY